MAPPGEGHKSCWMGFLDKTNVTVTALTAVFLLVSHTTGVAYFCFGAVMCSITVKLVKRAIRQPRPTHPSQRKVSYGMPSTHSAVISYYAAYFPLACAYDHTDTFLPAGSVWRVFMPPVVVIWATFIALSRIWLGHHTWPQVAVGCLYGIVFAFFWFTLWTSHLYEYGRLVDSAVDSLIRGFR